jgi:hypothetical protein
MALSAVGAAFSAGVVAVCAPASEVNAKTPASATMPISDPIDRPIAISFFSHASQEFWMAIIAFSPPVKAPPHRD